MLWAGVLYVVNWCIGLLCFMYWTAALHVLDWCVANGHQNISGGYEQDHVVKGMGQDHVEEVFHSLTGTLSEHD